MFPASLPASLADAPIGQPFVVSHVVAPPGAPEWAHQLEDIGFIRGERVAVLARGLVGGDPIVVRVGLSTFALRKAEAACVHLLAATAAQPVPESLSAAVAVAA
jgi:ferrous iron transport protein A